MDFVRSLPHRRQPASFLHARATAPDAGAAGGTWFRVEGRAGGGVPPVPAGRRGGGAGSHTHAGPAAPGDAAQSRLSVFERASLRRAGAVAGDAAAELAGARLAAAFARGGVRPESGGGDGGRRERNAARRLDAAAAERDQAGDGARRVSRELHVPPADAARRVFRLAPASFAGRRRNRTQLVRRGGRPLPARAAMARGFAVP